MSVIKHCRECGKEFQTYACYTNRVFCCSNACRHKHRTQNVDGQRFGKWTALTRDESKRDAYLCRCECGTERLVPLGALKRGDSKSCGCIPARTGSTSNARKDLTGGTFGRWTVLSMRWDSGKGFASCKCTCGTVRDVAAATLSNGHSTSCGCIASEKAAARTKHGGCSGDGDQLYSVWHDMRRRCSDPRREDYPLYGARGIYVCDGWQDFGSFRADMGERQEGLTIDRIDPNGSYTCGHCDQCTRMGAAMNARWATSTEQARNRRSTVMVTWNDVTLPLAAWAEKTGIGYYTLHNRIVRRKWSPGRAMTTKPVVGTNQFT